MIKLEEDQLVADLGQGEHLSRVCVSVGDIDQVRNSLTRLISAVDPAGGGKLLSNDLVLVHDSYASGDRDQLDWHRSIHSIIQVDLILNLSILAVQNDQFIVCGKDKFQALGHAPRNDSALDGAFDAGLSKIFDPDICQRDLLKLSLFVILDLKAVETE